MLGQLRTPGLTLAPPRGQTLPRDRLYAVLVPVPGSGEPGVYSGWTRTRPLVTRSVGGRDLLADGALFHGWPSQSETYVYLRAVAGDVWCMEGGR